MFRIVEQSLTPEVYCALRKKVSFQPYKKEDVAVALSQTFYTVEVREGETTVGIARVVGDGRIVFFLKDVVVDPMYRGCGIGRMLMDAIISHIQSQACNNAYIGLMATPGSEGFYQKFGFVLRPSPGFGSGMVRFIHQSESLQKEEVTYD